MIEGKAPELELRDGAYEDHIAKFDDDFAGTKSSPEDMMAMQRMGKKQQLVVRGALRLPEARS